MVDPSSQIVWLLLAAFCNNRGIKLLDMVKDRTLDCTNEYEKIKHFDHLPKSGLTASRHHHRTPPA
jgi:hypothetical protein